MHAPGAASQRVRLNSVRGAGGRVHDPLDGRGGFAGVLNGLCDALVSTHAPVDLLCGGVAAWPSESFSGGSYVRPRARRSRGTLGAVLFGGGSGASEPAHQVSSRSCSTSMA